MEFDYKNNTVEKLFIDLYNVSGSKNLMKKEIGDLTVAVKKRCNQLKASDTYAIFAKTGLGKPHSLEGREFENCIAISITGNVRIIIKPIPPDLSANALAICKKIEIIGVVDYHGRKTNWLIP